MECNKEEARRARDIAEIKMRDKDFSSGRRILLKAQRLFSDLENLSLMLIVCEVHCCAEQKLFGGETDWYGILQIQQTADETMIKKQYRKFALQLHPDKNKFPGAEAAFKLIGEAQGVLLDKNKRYLHDLRRNAASKQARASAIAQKTTTTSTNVQKTTNGTDARFQNNSRSNFAGMNSQQAAAQPGFSNGRPTFWTTCPFCSAKHQHFIDVINRSVFCGSCTKVFVAYETSAPGVATKPNFNQPVNATKTNVDNQGTRGVNVARQVNSGAKHVKTEFFAHETSGPGGSVKANKPDSKCTSRVDVARQANSSAKHSKTEFSRRGSSTGFNSHKEHQPNSNSTHSKAEFSQHKNSFPASGSQNVNNKKRKKGKATSSESSESDSSKDSDEESIGVGVSSNQHAECPRRSGRSRQKVSYTENRVDDDDLTHKENPDVVLNGENQAGNKKSDGHAKTNASGTNLEMHVDPTSESNSISESQVSPDPEFNDFDKDRQRSCFSVNQIWAAYDPLDAMPRFYAIIKQVQSPIFRLKITWLEPDPDDENEKEWIEEGNPVACGKFKLGNRENIDTLSTFSHLVCWKKSIQRGRYEVFPQKGEIWALFRNWDSKWKGIDDMKLKYDFVEILTDFTEGIGVCVAYLGKIKGFVSLFCRVRKNGQETIQITRGELFRFSHLVPSFKLTGQERQDVPEGAFELDPSSLPERMEEVELPQEYVHKQPKRSNHMHDKDIGDSFQDCDYFPSVTIDDTEVPEPEFYNFDEDKSTEKFSAGQIWSLYSDEDALPKYYGLIKEVSQEPFKVTLKWLENCFLPENSIPWHDKQMLVACGIFKLKKGRGVMYKDTGPFSHQMTTVPTAKHRYTIYPKMGDVWAIYRDWSPELKKSELKNCKYDMVEVNEQISAGWIVTRLEKVKEYDTVFRGQTIGSGILVKEVVPLAELLRFSHQVPAFRLTNEKGGRLRGFWEIDPLALPASYFSTH